MLNWMIHGDGSFSVFGDRLAIENAYPALDGTFLRPIKVDVKEEMVTYTLSAGMLHLTFARREKNVVLHAELQGYNPHDLSLIDGGILTSCTKGFGQGMGLGGPSGFYDLKKQQDFASEAVVAVGTDEEVLTLHFADQHEFRSHFAVKDGRLSARIDTECVFAEGKELPALEIAEAETFSDGLTACARDIAREMQARPVTQAAFHWCSWYYLYHTLDQGTLEAYLEGFKQHKEKLPFSHIQIDAGYFTSCGDWLHNNERFPLGMKHAADTILAAGYEPGIWIAPYMVGDESIVAKEHPDWLLRYTDGSYVRPWRRYNEPKPWGYRDSDYYVLDISHPDAMQYIRSVFATFRSWGYSLFKTDFLFWGLQDSSKVLRHTPGKTSFAYFRELMAAIREEIGDARWLGCIAPFMPSVGYVDMMRVAGDVGAKWEEDGFGPTNMIRELNADQYFNNIYWQNDPDAVMLRDFHIWIEQPQIEALALFAAMCGGTVYTSDPIHKIGENRQRLLSFIKPGVVARPVYPDWQKGKKDTLIVNHLPQGSVVYWFNATNEDCFETPDWKELCGEDAGFVYEYHGSNKDCGQVPYVVIPPRSGKLFFVTKKELAAEPDNLWVW